jgi:ketosteroid isomerase-like protein
MDDLRMGDAGFGSVLRQKMKGKESAQCACPSPNTRYPGPGRAASFSAGALFCCLACLTLVGCANEQARNQAMIASSRAVDANFTAAYNKGDVDGVMSNYWHSPDLVVYSPVALQARGWDDVKKGMAQGLAGAPGAQIKLTESHYEVHGDVVFCWGTWRMSLGSKDGIPFVVEGRYSDIKAERDGKWVFIFDHASIPWPLAP